MLCPKLNTVCVFKKFYAINISFLRYFKPHHHSPHCLPEPGSKSYHQTFHLASLCAQVVSTNANPTLLSCCLEGLAGSPLARGPSPPSQLDPHGSRPWHLLPQPPGTLTPSTLCVSAWLWAFRWVGGSFCCCARLSPGVNTPPSAFIRLMGPLLSALALPSLMFLPHSSHQRPRF